MLCPASDRRVRFNYSDFGDPRDCQCRRRDRGFGYFDLGKTSKINVVDGTPLPPIYIITY